MLQKEGLLTKSLKSSISETSVQYVKGVGPGVAKLLAIRDINTVRDLLYFFPRKYEDRTQATTIANAQPGEKTTFHVQVEEVRKLNLRGNRFKSMLEIRVADNSGKLWLKWFRAPSGYENRFKPGQSLHVTGVIKIFQNRKEIIHPEIDLSSTPAASLINEVEENATIEKSAHLGRIVPIYTDIPNITPRAYRKIVHSALEAYVPQMSDPLPKHLLSKHNLPELGPSLRNIHFPDVKWSDEEINRLLNFNTPYQHRLIYEEFLLFQLLVLNKKASRQEIQSIKVSLDRSNTVYEHWKKLLPFTLTNDQQKCINEIFLDFDSGRASHRLIQGDVGSGKTIVAMLAGASLIAEGYQVALMAPTEVLAEQHFKTAKKIFGDKIHFELWMGSTPESQRKLIQADLSKGRPLFLIGTHALIQDGIEMPQLGLVLIDEQHRFGVEQRRKLVQKGKTPHFLSFSATPIPRSLAITLYGDLSVSIIREKPPGRTPIHTKFYTQSDKTPVYDLIKNELNQGRQAYFVYPLIQESEADGFQYLKSVEKESAILQREIFPDYKIRYFHGNFAPAEKEKTLQDFKDRKFDILVSTTVIEVGIDVPNATVMVIENAERFGLSQLHQLRGRVGRGQYDSYCFLMANSRISEKTAERLQFLAQNEDGFDIAEFDLKIRGAGELLGTRQAGAVEFQMGDLVRDQVWMIKAREDAEQLIHSKKGTETHDFWSYLSKHPSFSTTQQSLC